MKLEKGGYVGSGSSVAPVARPPVETLLPVSSSFNLSVTLSLPSWTGPSELTLVSEHYQDHCLSILNLIRQGDFTKLSNDVCPFFFL